MFGDTFPLYRNLGDGQFEDDNGKSGLTVLTSRLTAWGAGDFDFDNDGNKDLFIAGSEILDNSMEIAHRPFALPDRIFRNKGGLVFEESSAGLPKAAPHRGAAFGDFNNDGKIDVVVSVINGPPELLMNRSNNNHHWITLKLIGVKSNRDGLGTRITVTTAHGMQYNHATTTVGYNSSSDKRVHFGLGADAVIQQIDLSWPSGVRQRLSNIKADQILTIKESSR